MHKGIQDRMNEMAFFSSDPILFTWGLADKSLLV